MPLADTSPSGEVSDLARRHRSRDPPATPPWRL